MKQEKVTLISCGRNHTILATSNKIVEVIIILNLRDLKYFLTLKKKEIYILLVVILKAN